MSVGRPDFYTEGAEKSRGNGERLKGDKNRDRRESRDNGEGKM